MLAEATPIHPLGRRRRRSRCHSLPRTRFYFNPDQRCERLQALLFVSPRLQLVAFAITMYLKHPHISIVWIVILGSHSVKEDMSTLQLSWSAEADFLVGYLLEQFLWLVGQTDGRLNVGVDSLHSGIQRSDRKSGMKTIDSDKGFFAAMASNQYGVPFIYKYITNEA